MAGAGRFGTRALEGIGWRHPQWRLSVADMRPGRIAGWSQKGIETYDGDAVDVLDGLLDAEPPHWIVPAVPFHLAFEWVLRKLSRRGTAIRRPLPSPMPVPNPMDGAAGDLYASLATFRCPEQCAEPAGGCTVTGERRPIPLYRLLGDLTIPNHRVIGIRSYQLAPGAGGVRGKDMLRLLATVRETPGDWVVFTSCRCHAVLSALRWPG